MRRVLQCIPACPRSFERVHAAGDRSRRRTTKNWLLRHLRNVSQSDAQNLTAPPVGSIYPPRRPHPKDRCHESGAHCHPPKERKVAS